MKSFIAGLAVGLGLGIAFAPGPGTSTRSKLRQKATDVAQDFMSRPQGSEDDKHVQRSGDMTGEATA